MGIKKSFINLDGILAPNWVTHLGSASLSLVGTGTHVMVPAPPAGKLRVLGKFSFYSPVVAQATLVASDGATTTGDFDYAAQINNTQIDQAQTGQSVATIPSSNNPTVILQPGEAYKVNVSALNGGANRVLVYVSWLDLDFESNISVLRTSIPDTTPVVVIPAVPTGKTANVYNPPVMLTGSANGWAVFNADDVTHNFNFELVLGAVVVLVASFSVNAGEASAFSPPVVPATAVLRLTMQEGVDVTAPTLYGAYALLDL
jgi:hypothetical protein